MLSKKLKFYIPVISIGLFVVLIFCYYLSNLIIPNADNSIDTVIAQYNMMKAVPLANYWNKYTPVVMLIGFLFYFVFILYICTMNKVKMAGREYGTSKLDNPSFLTAKLADHSRDERDLNNLVVWKKKKKCIVNTRNRMLSEHVYMSLDTKKTNLNNNILIIGGSGCGKTFRFAKPNLMQMSSSFIVTDPKGEICRDTAGFLRSNGYQLKVLNLEEIKKSSHYNPFEYIRSDTDVIKLIGNLIKNTTPKGASPSDPFWEKAEGMFLQSLFQYVWRVGVEDEDGVVRHNIGAVLQLLNEADFKEDPRSGAKLDSLLDLRMNRLEKEDPSNPAVLKYNKVMRGAADTVRSIIISANSRLAPVENEDIIELMSSDEIDIESIGTQKTAVFCVIPDSDDTYNFLVGLLYTQMFQLLYDVADNVYGGSLPVHVTFLLDEFANVALPDGYCSLLSTMRSRSISSIIIIQNMAQIKALFEKTYETIQGNCDTIIFLGSNEFSTQEYISKMMGKQTIYKTSTGITRGKSGSSSKNEDVLGRELMFPEEIRKLKRDECLILVNGYNPVKDKKISTLDHPMFFYLQEFSKDYTFDGRVERARKRRVSSNGNSLPESINMDKVNYLITLDKKVMEEYKKEAHICKITGDTPPDKPKSNVITLTEDQLMSLDFSDTDVSLVDWEKVFISIDTKDNINEILENEAKEVAYPEALKDTVKKELQTAAEAKLYLRLSKEGYDINKIRILLKLSRESSEYTDELILKYFSPTMELGEIEEFVELLVG